MATRRPRRNPRRMRLGGGIQGTSPRPPQDGSEFGRINLSGDNSNIAGDLNQDGIQNILDLVILVNIILEN